MGIVYFEESRVTCCASPSSPTGGHPPRPPLETVTVAEGRPHPFFSPFARTASAGRRLAGAGAPPLLTLTVDMEEGGMAGALVFRGEGGGVYFTSRLAVTRGEGGGAELRHRANLTGGGRVAAQYHDFLLSSRAPAEEAFPGPRARACSNQEWTDDGSWLTDASLPDQGCHRKRYTEKLVGIPTFSKLKLG